MAAGLRKTNRRLLVTSITSSAGSTLAAGVTAVTGPLIGAGIPGWRTACIVAALLAFISTITAGINQQLRYGERVSRGDQCVGKLQSLELTLSSGSSDWQVIATEYREIARRYPEFVH